MECLLSLNIFLDTLYVTYLNHDFSSAGRYAKKNYFLADRQIEI